MAAVPLAGLSLTYLVLFRDGAKDTGRWGVRRRAVEVGASPYRAHASHEELAQGAPLGLRFISWLAAMGGVVTMGVLAPAGLVLIFVVLDNNAVFCCLAIFGVAASGFPAGVVLIQVARGVTKNQVLSRSSFNFLYGHHIAVLIVMLVVDATTNTHVSGFSAVVCAIFVGLIATLHGAARIAKAEEPSS